MDQSTGYPRPPTVARSSSITTTKNILGSTRQQISGYTKKNRYFLLFEFVNTVLIINIHIAL